jgi:hypothetical protein
MKQGKSKSSAHGGEVVSAEERAWDEGMRHFYTVRCNTAIGDNHNLIKKSLYAFQVYM